MYKAQPFLLVTSAQAGIQISGTKLAPACAEVTNNRLFEIYAFSVSYRYVGWIWRSFIRNQIVFYLELLVL